MKLALKQTVAIFGSIQKRGTSSSGLAPLFLGRLSPSPSAAPRRLLIPSSSAQHQTYSNVS